MFVRGKSFILVSFLGCIISSAASAQISFVERCLGKPELTDVRITCSYQGPKMKYPVSLTLENGDTVISRTGVRGNSKKVLYLYKVQHLPPRLTDKGVIADHVRLLAKNGGSIAVMDLPCGDSTVSLLGAGTGNEEKLPEQEIGQCSVN